MTPPSIKADDVLSWIRPRPLGRLERCPECKTEPTGFGRSRYRLRADFHPAHQYGPCMVNVGERECGCRYGLPVLKKQT
jgi:hypothetical protein